MTEDEHDEETATITSTEKHRAYLIMLTLIQKPSSRITLRRENTLWAVVDEEELLSIFTIVDENEEPIKPHPFLRQALGGMVEAIESGEGRRRIAHTLVLHEHPSARTDAMLRIVGSLRRRARTWSQFSKKYRKKGWPQLMDSLFKKASEEELANLAAGMLYIVMSPAVCFDQIRSLLRKLEIPRPIDSIERFVEYIDEISEEEFTVRDLEAAVGARLMSLSKPALSYTVSEADESFLLREDHVEVVNLFPLEAIDTRAVYSSTARLDEDSLSVVETAQVDIEDASTQALAGNEQVNVGSMTSSSPFETPIIDEETDRSWVKNVITKCKEQRYVELKRQLHLDDEKYLVRFVKAFVGLANRSAVDNRRGHIIVGAEDFQQPSGFRDDASYQQLIKEWIRPKPDFTFVHLSWPDMDAGVFLIHPTADRPFVVAKDLRPRDDSKYLLEGQCYLRQGTETILLTENDMFKLARDIALKYGRH